MKRMTAYLISLCLFATCILPARAAEAGIIVPQDEVRKETGADAGQNGKTNDDMGMIGQVSSTGSPSVESASPATASPTSETMPGADVSPTPETTPGADVSPTPETTPGTDTSPTPEGTPGADITPSPAGTSEAQTSPSPAASPSVESVPSAIPSGSPQAQTSPSLAASPGAESTPSATPTALASPSPTATPDMERQSLADEEWNNETPSENPGGGIEVIVRNTLPIERLSLKVTLEKDNNEVDGRSVELAKNPEKHAVFFDVESGDYRVKVSALGFITYEQEIAVAPGKIQTAEIHTGFVNLEGISYTEDGVHPGVMLIGDANGDGQIDENDKNAIMDAMSGIGNDGLTTDLNRDGKTDLVDLQYYANSRARIKENAVTASSLSGKIAPDAVQVNINGANTQAQGDLDALFSADAGSVKLQRAQGGIISQDTPVEIGFNLQSGEREGVLVEQIEISMGESGAASGQLTVETEDGKEIIPFVDGRVESLSRMSGEPSGPGTGPLVVYLGKQVAIKKVSIRITKTGGDGTLAEITKVEFLNDMEKRIPEPDMNIPENLKAAGADKAFHLTWDPQVNVTGYEVEISYGGMAETVRTASNRLEVKSFNREKLVNEQSYEVRVRSVNGTWSSPYSDKVLAVPQIADRPDPPDNVKAVGGHRSVTMSWKKMEDTDFYNVFYKEAGTDAFQKIPNIGQNKYVITGLKDETLYEVYVTGVNDLGESNPSLHAEAKTITLKPAKMPNYKLLNESTGDGRVSAHIVSVTHGRGSMESSPLDQDSKSALGTVDKDFGSYYQVLDWDDGAEYVAASKGLLFTLDDYYKMSYIAFAEPEDIASYGKVSVYYYDKENPDGVYAQNVSVTQRTDENGRKYYMIKLASPITANKIRLGFARGYGLRNITIAEVNFYHYDSLEDDILALYADDLHTTLRDDVTEAMISELQKRLDTVDAKSGEYHPEREMLQRELDNARGILSSGLRDVIEISSAITAARDGHLGFGGLNAWQPLGITAYEGERIVVYVGHNTLKTGSNSALKLIATQYHAESGAFASDVGSLKVGRNEITIPSIQSLACEGGGALYIQYTGNNENDRYAVRISGGVKEPVLNLYGVSDESERKALILSYVKELEEHTASQKSLHEQVHEAAGEGNKVNRKYEEQNCIIGATDIMLDRMLLSVSAQQILAGLGNGSSQERAQRLENSLQAMEDMMELFYQHKGLSDDASAPATDRMPAQHLNIRYMRMFAGAFMYASGNHIGIEWGSVPGLAGAAPVVSDENGKYISGNYFGWGISHEIGHNINQGSYAIAEVTNNYFAQLTRSRDSDDTVRFKYENVYEKVTSGTVGRPSNVFTHLAMYWQLHLAYDRDYNYKTYGSYQEQHDSLFYARVDSYSRNTALAPGGLTLGGDADQNIMRLACAAAQKDLTEFFTRWGLVPDGDTMSYAGQFPKEERAIYYLTDDARVYEMEHGVTGSVKDSNVIGADSSVTVNEKVPNEVTVSIQNPVSSDVILGYEIARYYYENGKPVRQVVGFSTQPVYRDHVTSLNNRVLTYEVTAVDKYGYRSKAGKIGDVRISHDGSYDKSLWTVTTNMASESDSKDTATEEDPCDPQTVSAIYRVIDNDYGNTYEGFTASSDAVVTLCTNQALAVCGLKYTVKSANAIGAYEIQVSMDGNNWTTVKTGAFEERKESQIVYFENSDRDPWVCTYDAAYVRIKALGQNHISIAELDLLGPAGDSVSFGVKENDTQGAVGILTKDYVYEAEGENSVIPAGSLIFTGSYKGNPAYNVVMLYDEEGAVVGGVDEDGVLIADQIILANVPENGLLGEVSDGIWIYWISPVDGQVPDLGGKIVRAQLYRVDNALTNEGQRLVSDTEPLRIPDKLDEITLVRDSDHGVAVQ